MTTMEPVFEDVLKACEDWDVELVRHLLADQRIDPSAQHNILIREASEYGDIDMVRLLLSYSRVDPPEDAIYWAMRSRNTEIVELLLSDKRVQSRLASNDVLRVHVERYLQLTKLEKLPTLKQNQIALSERIFRLKCSSVDVHQLGLNVLGGSPVDKLNQELLYKMEQCFIKHQSIVESDLFVFRGVRVDNRDKLIHDNNSVTFASWSITKALNYAYSPAVESAKYRDRPILMIIQLKKGVPIIRTQYSEEIILPISSQLRYLNNVRGSRYPKKIGDVEILYFECIKINKGKQR